MDDIDIRSPKFLIYAMWVVLVNAAIMVVAAAGVGKSGMVGMGIHRLSQLLFVTGFLLGAVGFNQLRYRRYTIGCSFLAVGWGLLFTDWLLADLLGDLFVFSLLTMFVVGIVFFLVGIVTEPTARRSGDRLSDVGADDSAFSD